MNEETSPDRLVRLALDYIKQYSIQRSTPEGQKFEWYHSPATPIQWDEFEAKAFCDLRSVENPDIEDVCGVVDRSLMRLQDCHSLLSYPGYKRSINPDYVARTDPRQAPELTWAYHKKNWHQPIALRTQPTWDSAYTAPEAIYRDDILLLKVPHFYMGAGPEKREVYQNTLRDALLAGAAKSLRAVIVDLTVNYGGSMRPMLRGLSPLLGPQTLGYFAGAGGQTPWSVNYRQAEKDILATDDKRNFPLIDTPVAVLAGKDTCSSGEVVFLSLQGRPHTQSFGDNTAGKSSSNESIGLTPDRKLQMHICSETLLNRHHRGSGKGDRAKDGGPIPVDHFTNAPLDEALQWIRAGAPPLAPSSQYPLGGNTGPRL
ncbi:MAG: S41 family peptidase [Alphaproteobacteria bacterium]|nr:S41 family peptidase [Alphaproteobacteria bacterium]